MELYNVTWHERYGDAALKLLVWDEGKKKNVYIDFPIKPMFFIRMADFTDKFRDVVFEIDSSAKFTEFAAVWQNEPLVKIEVARPDAVKDIRKQIEIPTYEADVPYVRRVMIEMGLGVAIPTRILYYDIEVDPRGGFPDVDKAEKRILSISAIDQDGNFWGFSDDNETKTINQFLDLTEDYIVISGWNSERFDYPYLRNRCKKLGIHFDWFRLVHVDLYPMYKKMTKRKKPTDYKLDTVGKEEVGMTKLRDFEAQLKVTHLWDLFESNRDLLLLYNVHDARITRAIDQKFKITTAIFSIAQITHTLVKHLLERRKGIEPGINMSIAVDGLLLSLASQRKPRIAFPTKRWHEDVEEDSEEVELIGGKTFSTVQGLHERVVDFDVSSMYPSIIRTFNIGTDTYRDSGGEIKGVVGTFTREPESLFSEACRMMREAREKVNTLRKKAVPDSTEYWILYGQQYAFKEVLLSFYGVMGSKYSRHFSEPVAGNITGIGRLLLTKAKEFVERQGLSVVYGDTDSLFTVFDNNEDVVTRAQKVVKQVQQELADFCRKNFGIQEFYVDIDIDRIYSRFYLTGAKKKYAGIVIWQGTPTCYLHTVGMELMRKDWPIVSGQIQKEILKMLLSGAKRAVILSYLNSVKVDLFAGKLDSQLVMRKGIGKEFADYTSYQPHLKAAQKLIGMGVQVRTGDKITYIRIGPKNTDIIPIIGDEVHVKISPKGYRFVWENSILPIVERLGIGTTEQMTLGSFA